MSVARPVRRARASRTARAHRSDVITPNIAIDNIHTSFLPTLLAGTSLELNFDCFGLWIETFWKWGE